MGEFDELVEKINLRTEMKIKCCFAHNKDDEYHKTENPICEKCLKKLGELAKTQIGFRYEDEIFILGPQKPKRSKYKLIG